MRLSLVVAVLAASLGAAVAGCRAGSQPATPSAQPFPVVDAKAKVLARQAATCPDGSQADAGATVFRSAKAWDGHLATLPQLIRAPLGDWRPDFPAGESVVLAHAGELPNPGYRVAVAEPSLPIRAGVLQLSLTAVPPPRESMQAQVMTPACLYLRLDRGDYREVAVEVVR